MPRTRFRVIGNFVVGGMRQLTLALANYTNLKASKMMTIDIPDELQRKIISFARLAGQTPEQAILEIIEERIDHQSAYSETAYLMESHKNKERLDNAIKDIRNGIFEEKELIND